MVGLFFSLLDHILAIVFFGWIAYLHSDFNKKPTPQKREWLLGISCLLVLYHTGALVIDLAKDRPVPVVATTKPPEKTFTTEEIFALLKSDGQRLEEEKPITIPHGPIITLPQGYAYVLPPSGATRLFARGPRGETVVLMETSDYSDLANVEKQVRVGTKQKEGQTLGPSHAVVINGCDSLIMEASNLEKNYTGHMVLTSNGRFAYILMIGASKEQEKAVQAEHFRVIHSLAAAIR